jgi:hypothetical protein
MTSSLRQLEIADQNLLELRRDIGDDLIVTEMEKSPGDPVGFNGVGVRMFGSSQSETQYGTPATVADLRTHPASSTAWWSGIW